MKAVCQMTNHRFNFFFFNDTATTEIYTLSLHDALPILAAAGLLLTVSLQIPRALRAHFGDVPAPPPSYYRPGVPYRSEEHTSELQSQSNLVCRLLLEKKKTHPIIALGLSAMLSLTILND